jgi:hypothetical protein
MGALADARARIAQGAAEEQQSKVKLGMSEKELAELEQRNRAFAKEAENYMKKIDNIKAAVQAIEAKIVNCGWSQEKDQDLEKQLREAREEVKNLTEVGFCMLSLFLAASDSYVCTTATRPHKIPHRAPQLRLRRPHTQLRPTKSQRRRRPAHHPPTGAFPHIHRPRNRRRR